MILTSAFSALAPYAKAADCEFQEGGSHETTMPTVPVLLIFAASPSYSPRLMSSRFFRAGFCDASSYMKIGRANREKLLQILAAFT